MASCSTSLLAPSAPMKIVPYVPRALKPKSKPKPKAKPLTTNNTAEHSYSGVSSSNNDDEWLHIDDFPMPDTNALRPLDSAVPAPFEAPDAFKPLDRDVAGSLSAASELEKPKRYPSGQEPLDGGTDHAIGVAKMDLALDSLFDGSSLESSLVLGSDAAEEYHNTTQTKPTSGALSCQGNGYLAITGTEGIHTEQDSNVDFASISVPSAEGVNSVHFAEDGLSPLEDEQLIDIDMMDRSLSARKRTRRSLSDAITSLREMPDIPSDSELEDTQLGKRRRLSNEQAESLFPYHVPTPKPTPLPTPSSPSLSSRASSDGQSGGAQSPVLSRNNLDEEDDHGAYAQHVVGKGNRKGSDNLAAKTHEDFGQVEKVSGRPRVKLFRQSKRSNRPAQDKECCLVRRGRITMPTRKSRNVTLAQLRQLSRPRSDDASQSCSPRTASPRMKARGRTTTVRPSANMAYQITDLTHCHVPEGSSILTAVVRSESNLSLSPIVLEHELLGDKGKVIRIMQLSPDSWILLGYRHDSTSSTSTRESTAPDNAEWVSSSRSDAASDDIDHSNDEDEEYGKDLRNAAKSDIRCRQRTREPWLESDEERLLSYKDKMGMPWDEICGRFPDRSPGAVKLRYHILHRRNS